jgi:hypothetical protein
MPKNEKVLGYVIGTNLSMRGVIWLGTATQMQRRHQAAASLAAWQGWTSTVIIASIKPIHKIYIIAWVPKWKNILETRFIYLCSLNEVFALLGSYTLCNIPEEWRPHLLFSPIQDTHYSKSFSPIQWPASTCHVTFNMRVVPLLYSRIPICCFLSLNIKFQFKCYIQSN